MPQTLINVHSFLQDFNPSKFTVHSSVLIFSILFSLRLDNKITVSYWLIFLPLWIWKSIALIGAFVGVIVWLAKPEYRVSNSSYIHFKSMLISIALQLLLLMFEILVCDKLENKRHHWSSVFVPLVFMSLLSISVCVWSVKNGRNIELEMFAAINIMQIILIPIKLDGLINWSWIVVFIPSWILLCFAIVVVLYAMVFAAIVLRSPDTGTEQRRASIQSASSTSLIFLPLLGFIILLANKLDSSPSSNQINGQNISFFVTSMPLFITLMILIRLSFGSNTYSLWWFGMRADFCTFLLTIFPCLKEYGNTSFTINARVSDTVADTTIRPIRTDSISNQQFMSHQSIDSQTTENYQNFSRVSGQRVENSSTHGKKFLFGLTRIFSSDKRGNQHCQFETTAPEESHLSPKLIIDAPD